MVKAGTHTQEQAAVAVGVSQPAVSKAIRNITEKAVTAKKVISPPQPTIKLAKDPALTAKNIKAKMGEEYAARLGDVSGMQMVGCGLGGNCFLVTFVLFPPLTLLTYRFVVPVCSAISRLDASGEVGTCVWSADSGSGGRPRRSLQKSNENIVTS